MKVLFVAIGSGNGGHSRSALSTALALRDREIQVTFLVGFDTKVDFLANSGIQFRRITPCMEPNLDKVLIAYRDSLPFDVVHYFGSPRSAVPFAIGAAELRKKFCLTIPGGRPPISMFGFKEAVAFTDELSQDIRSSVDLHLMPARIDVANYNTKIANLKTSIREKVESFLGCDTSAFIVGKIGRISTDSIEEIIGTAKDVVILRELGHDIRYIHIGHPHSYTKSRRLKKYFSTINRKCGETVVATVQKSFPEHWTYSLGFDMQIASGRSALEALICGTPTLQRMGENQYVLFCESTLPTLAKKNFTARSATQLEGEVRNLLVVKNAVTSGRENIKSLYQRFILNYDVSVAANFYLEYYKGIKILRDDDLNRIKAASRVGSVTICSRIHRFLKYIQSQLIKCFLS